MIRMLLLICLYASFALAQGKPSCLHLRHEGTIFSLSYPESPCTHADIKLLPQNLYDEAEGWASNSAYAKVMSEFTAFQIKARLAVSDYSESHGFAHGPCSFGPWADYGWSENADHAYLGLVDKLGMDHSLVAALREATLKAGLARKDKFFGMTFKEKKLSPSKRHKLESIFKETESQLVADHAITMVEISLADKLRKEPWTKPTFSKFELLK